MKLLWSLRFPDPILFLIMGMRSLEGLVVPILVADRVASSLNVSHYSNLERNPCLANNTGDEELVQAVSARWIMAYFLAGSLPGAVTAILIGGWSDRVGRRVPVLLSVGGYIFSAACIAAVAYWELPLAVFIAGVTVQGVFGGYPTIMLAVYAYTSDISRPERRTSRMMLLTALEFLGSGGMNLVGGFMLRAHGVVATECIVLGGHCLNFLYTALLLASSRDTTVRTVGDPPHYSTLQAGRGPESSLAATTSPENTHSYLYSIKKTYRLILKPWAHRGELILIMTSFQILVFNFLGPNGLTALYVLAHPLCWSATMFGYFSAARYAANLLSLLTLAPLVRLLKIPDRYIVQFSIPGMIAFFGVIAIADKTYQMFVAAACMFVMGPGISTFRSMMSKLVSAEDQGAVFALIASLELAVTVLSTVVYNSIYSYLVKQVTISFLPSSGNLCFVIAAATTLISILLVCFLPRKEPVSVELPGTISDSERKPLLTHGSNVVDPSDPTGSNG